MNERRNTAKKKKTVKLMNLDRLERTDMDKQNVAGKDETYKKLYLDNCHNKARKPEYVINGCNLYKVAVKGKGDSLEVEEAAFIGKAVKVKNIKEDVSTKIRICVLEYYTYGDKWDVCEVEMDKVSDMKLIVGLSQYGIDVTSANAKDVMLHLKNEEEKATVLQCRKEAGIILEDGKAFYIGRVVLQKGRKKPLEGISYNGQLAIMQEGSREEYLKMVREDVLTSVEMTTVLLMGLSAPVIGYIGDECGVLNIFAHISGESTTGKSTALKLVASLFGSCGKKDGRNGLFATWNATSNALVERMSSMYGIPVVLDEAGMSQIKDPGEMIYTIAEGKEKERMQYGKGNSRVREWRTAIISSGEIPLDNGGSDAATGKKIRLLSFEGKAWTRDAAHSERIKNTVEHHYGFLGEEFVKRMFSIKKDSIIKSYKQETKKLCGILQCGSYNRRIAAYLSMILTAGRILNKMGLEAELKGVRGFLVDTVNSTRGSEISYGQRAFEAVLADISKNQARLEKRTMNGSAFERIAAGDVYGVAYYRNKDETVMKEVAVPKIQMDEVLKSKGFKNTELAYSQWMQDGKIKKNAKNGSAHKTVIGGVKVDCIKLAFPEQDILEELKSETFKDVLKQKAGRVKQLTEADVEKDDFDGI